MIDTRVLSHVPQRIYGDPGSPIILRIGNGGAGPTGILESLALKFLALRNAPGRVAWYQDISIHALEHMRNGRVDLVLVYERDQAQSALVQGEAREMTLVFYDHFLLLGPAHNPAGVSADDSIDDALCKIAARAERDPSRPAFLSRDDFSATNMRERLLWSRVHMQPWLESAWYYRFHAFPQAALLEADRIGAYLLSDHGTWLSTRKQVNHFAMFIRGGEVLLNPCLALVPPAPSAVAEEFLAFLRGSEGQECIRRFGQESYGTSLFTCADQPEF